MAEAVGFTSAIVTLVTTAYSSCQELYSTLDGVRNASKHIAAISNDLQDFYSVPGAIQALLDDEELSAGIAHYSHSESLREVLKNCIAVFKELKTIVSDYQAHEKNSAAGTWQHVKWIFKESEIKRLRSDLMGCKTTLNLAISVAAYYNIHTSHASSARIEEDMATYRKELERLPEILEQLEDLKAAQLPQAAPHGAIDRAGIKIDYRFALRHYVDSAASICSGMSTPSGSFQVSALETSSYQMTSKFYTAPMSQASNSGEPLPSRKCTQILVRNVGLHKTMAFQVVPEHTIEQIKSLVCERIGLENAEFELLYSSRVLYSSDKSIDEYGIPHDATLTCISFKPNHSPPAPYKEMSRVWMRTLILGSYREDFCLSIGRETLVHELKFMNAAQLKRPLSDFCLIFGGQVLEEDDRHLFDYGICDDSTIYIVVRARRPSNAAADRDAPAVTESTLPENPALQEDENTPPRNLEAKNILPPLPWVLKASLRVPRSPGKRTFHSMIRRMR